MSGPLQEKVRLKTSKRPYKRPSLSAAKLLSKDQARRIAVNFAKPKLMNAAAIAPCLVLQLEQLPCLPH
jgi:hypothetical protein